MFDNILSDKEIILVIDFEHRPRATTPNRFSAIFGRKGEPLLLKTDELIQMDFGVFQTGTSNRTGGSGLGSHVRPSGRLPRAGDRWYREVSCRTRCDTTPRLPGLTLEVKTRMHGNETAKQLPHILNLAFYLRLSLRVSRETGIDEGTIVFGKLVVGSI